MKKKLLFLSFLMAFSFSGFAQKRPPKTGGNIQLCFQGKDEHGNQISIHLEKSQNPMVEEPYLKGFYHYLPTEGEPSMGLLKNLSYLKDTKTIQCWLKYYVGGNVLTTEFRAKVADNSLTVIEGTLEELQDGRMVYSKSDPVFDVATLYKVKCETLKSQMKAIKAVESALID